MDSSYCTPFSRQVEDHARRVLQCGTAALGDLYDLAAPRLVRYALALTRNQADAEDALQAAMVRIAVQPRALSNAQHPWAYFLKVVRNEALRLMRKRRPAQAIDQLENWTELSQPAELAGSGDELREIVRLALGRLPPSQSEVVVLKVWEGMTFCEIAEVLGESQNTVASRYRYALEKLSHSLQSLSPELVDGR